MKKITITGTKGKTTVARLVDFVLREMGRKTLRVDNDGWYVHGYLLGTPEDSKKIFGLIPQVCPGKFLFETRYRDLDVAVFETAIGSSGSAGLGYKMHDFGIFLNVFDDHITGQRIKSRADIFKAKKFVFDRIRPGGVAIGNADDKYIQKAFKQIAPERGVRVLPYGICRDVNGMRLPAGRQVSTGVYAQGTEIFYRKQKIIDARDLDFAFNGQYKPSMYNLLAAIATIIAYNNFKKPRGLAGILKKYKVDKKGARLVQIERKGRKVIIDFAHERESLTQILSLGEKLGKRCLAVVRIAPDRRDEYIQKIARQIYNKADMFFVWDKIDGQRRRKYNNKILKIQRKVGETAKVLEKALKVHKDPAKIFNLLTEEIAIKIAIKNSQPGDCIIVISGDDKEYTRAQVDKFL